jgi:NAD(P)-dependent dehydrogenase (short-subunit alcohol dehydrogenase family)
MDLKLTDKCVIITGGTRNLGRALTLAFLQEGAKVVTTTYRRDGVATEDLLALVPSARRASLRVCKSDVSSDVACRELCTVAQREFGKVNILVNNAALNTLQALEEITDEDFETESYTTHSAARFT